MRSGKVEDVVLASGALSKEVSRLLDFLNNFVNERDESFDIKQEIIGKDSSTSQLCMRMLTVTEIIEKFGNSSHIELVPLIVINNLENTLNSCALCIQQLINHLDTNRNSHGGFKELNYSNFHALMLNGQNINCQAQFTALFDAVEALLAAYYQNLVALKPTKSNFSFQAAANALSEMLGRTEEDHDELRKRLSDLEEISEEVKASKISAGLAADEAHRQKQESASDRKTIGEYLTEVTEKQGAITSVHTEAITLSSQVDEYKDDFDKFQIRLDKRNEEFDSGTTKLEGLISSFDSQKQSVQDLVEQAEGMLKSATVAGLAGHFNEIRSNLTDELKWARRGFYAGIVFLLISAIPLVIMIFWPILAPLLEAYNPELASVLKGYSPKPDQTGWQYLGQILARFIILVPAAWFVSFSAIRHSSLFRLREHYTYKYSMAVSVEGFKKQARGYEDEIAALVLEQLAFNPADKLIPSKDIPEGKSPNPLMKFFMAKINKRFKDLNAPPE